MKFTGERAIIDAKGENEAQQQNIKRINKDHLLRYNLASCYVKGNILDCACGSGYGTDILNKKGHCLGVDISEEAITYAKREYGCSYSVYDLDKDFPNGAYDWIVSFETIEHINNPEFLLENIKRYSKNQIMSLPLNSPSEFHKHVYTKEQAFNLIQKYFTIEEYLLQKNRYLIFITK